MKGNWSIIPDLNHIEATVSLAEEFGAAFEYNDFCLPSVYEDPAECERRLRAYESLGRKCERDTLHGVFYDIVATSMDSGFRSRSRRLMEQSMEIAARLGCKGVVFHTGLVAGLNTDYYISNWVEQMSRYLLTLSERFPQVNIYLENTFEQTPEPLIRLMKACGDQTRLRLCLDYAHAVLTKTPVPIWVSEMGPYLGHMHINDNDLVSDLHLEIGAGRIDYRQFAKLIDPLQGEMDFNILLELKGMESQRASLTYMSEL